MEHESKASTAAKGIDPASESPLLTQNEAAAFLRVSTRTMQTIAQRGGGPVRIQLESRRVAYRRTDLEAEIDQRAAASAA